MRYMCRRCKTERSVIELRRHNVSFCKDCFLHYCREQVRKAIDEFEMIRPGDRVLVAVSGGKDSLAVWQILRDLGYNADGMYIGLGIDEYSDESGDLTRRFAEQMGWPLRVVDLGDEFGFTVPQAAETMRRAPCSSCGLSKRHVFDSVTLQGGYDVLVTGHNLDDEAAVLFGNVMRWSSDYLGRQRPVLDASEGFPKKAKPLVRLTERETAAFCVLSGIDYQVEECPMAAGNRHLGYKELLNSLEEKSPGSKAAFYLGFLDRGLPRFEGGVLSQREALGRCSDCGAPTPDELCAFCRLAGRVNEAATRQPVTIQRKSSVKQQ